MKSESTARFSRRRARASHIRPVAAILVTCALALGASSLAGAALDSGISTSGKLKAHLTANAFAIYEAKWVKLSYKLPNGCKSFSYKFAVKKGSHWKPVASGTRKKSRHAISIKKLVGGRKMILGRKMIVGRYRLTLSAGKAHKKISFRLVPFSGHLTKKSFTVSKASSIKLIYGFSKPSKSFAYKIAYKQGSTWLPVSNGKKKKKKGYFKAQKTAKLTKLFAGRPFVVGKYRLFISSSYSTRHLNFKIITGGPSGTGGATDIGGSGGGSGGAGGIGFSISGGVSGLAPGVPKPIVLTLSNPNYFKLFVTKLTVTMSASELPAGCKSSWFVLTQSNASSSNPIAVPANGSTTLTSAPRAPQIELINSPTENQNACKGASFTLTFSGSAHS
jgi:hypothetical protein